MIRSVQDTGLLSNPFIFSAIHFLVFNVGDWVGRYLSIPLQFSRPASLGGVAARHLSLLCMLFIPLLLACNVVPPPSLPSYSPILLSMITSLTPRHTNGV